MRTTWESSVTQVRFHICRAKHSFLFMYSFQLMITIAMEMFVLWEDCITGRVEWRYLWVEIGEQSDIPVWFLMQQNLYASSWDYQQKVIF